MSHLNIIKWIDYIGGVFCILLALLYGGICIVGAGAIGLSGEEGSGIGAIIFGVFGIVLAVIFLVIGIVNFVAGGALVGLKGWAKWYHIIIGILNLGAFPVGTAIGGYFIWVLLMNEEVKSLFDSNRY